MQRSFLRLSIGKPSFLLPVLIVLFTLPLSVAHAGILSFFGGIFSRYSDADAEVAAPATPVTSVFLRAAVNPDPNPSKGGGDITVVGGSALLPEAGPLGMIADTPEQGSPKDRISVYVVREGDTLSHIAQMFGVSVNTIIWANDLGRRGTIRVGQTLIILPISGVQYTVAKGDTLASIAKKFKGNPEEILLYNGIADASELAVGDEIVIPNGEKEFPQDMAPQGGRTYATGGPVYDGYYLRPVPGGRKSQGIHGYNGVDLASPAGTAVFAASAGEIIVSRYSPGNPWFGGYGNYIVIQHDNGTQTLYAHLSDVIVSRGWKVVQGQVIGYVGSTGRSTGPHLHFEVRGAKNPF